MRSSGRLNAFVAACAAVSAGCALAARAAEPPKIDTVMPTFALSSSTFTEGAMLPVKAMDKSTAGIFGCNGQNVSPQLSWSGFPAATKSFAVIIHGVEGLGGLGEAHLLAYDIPVSTTSFAEGEASQPSDKFVGGVNARGLTTYSGGCVHAGPRRHYVFEVIASDLDPGILPPGLNEPELLARLKGHTKASAALVGLFGNP